MGIISSQTLQDQLASMLEQMDVCAQNMEGIIAQELQAAHAFDGDALEHLAEQRARSQSKIVELESQCKRLLKQYGASDHMSLEDFISAHAEKSDQSLLQGKRQRVLARMERMHAATEENRIRLHAAWCVTMHVLQEVGAMPNQEVYGRGVAR
jgi:hypothetical protein